MGYLHIANLYKDQTILLFKECYALEKIHGTSAHIRWKEGKVHLSPGGEKLSRFEKVFDLTVLKEKFEALGHPSVVVFGEAYGGSQQGQAHRYGKDLRFAAFDVKIEDSWLSVPSAADVVSKLGLEFVHYDRVPTDLVALDAARDAFSWQAKRNGVEGDHYMEGVVLRPLSEFTLNNGSRVIVKHKRDEERETNKPRKVVDPSQLEVLRDAEKIAEEWVTPTRLEHVLDKIPGAGLEQMRAVLDAMLEDVLREGAGELVDSKEARAAISRRTATLFKKKVISSLTAASS